MICEDCRFRKNKLRCAICIHLEERMEKENYVPTFALYPQREAYEKKVER